MGPSTKTARRLTPTRPVVAALGPPRARPPTSLLPSLRETARGRGRPERRLVAVGQRRDRGRGEVPGVVDCTAWGLTYPEGFLPRERGAGGRNLSLWSAQDLLRWVGFEVVGLSMVVAGWFVASGQGHYTDQVGPSTLAVGGVTVACVGHAMWVLRGRRAVGERYGRLLRQPWLVGTRPSHEDRVSEDSQVLVAGAGLRFFHRQECPLAAGRHWIALSRDEHVVAGRVPCGACRP
jgi:hypothetical protein